MFIIIGIMLTGMLFGYLLRSKRLTWIHKIITFLIWVLLFLLGIDVGGNDIIVKGLSDYPFMHLLYSQLLVCQRVCLQNTVCLICK